MKVTAEYFFEHNAAAPLQTVAPNTDDDSVDRRASARKCIADGVRIGSGDDVYVKIEKD